MLLKGLLNPKSKHDLLSISPNNPFGPHRSLFAGLAHRVKGARLSARARVLRFLAISWRARMPQVRRGYNAVKGRSDAAWHAHSREAVNDGCLEPNFTAWPAGPSEAFQLLGLLPPFSAFWCGVSFGLRPVTPQSSSGRKPGGYSDTFINPQIFA